MKTRTCLFEGISIAIAESQYRNNLSFAIRRLTANDNQRALAVSGSTAVARHPGAPCMSARETVDLHRQLVMADPEAFQVKLAAAEQLLASLEQS
jgi:hypothetical protein